MLNTLEDPFYYLHNFHCVLTCIGERYSDLLTSEEQAFLAHFPTLPQPSQALLVRMVMRKGELFRQGKLSYAEIGQAADAALPLLQCGWLDDQPPLSLEQLFGLLTKTELNARFGPFKPGLRKADALADLTPLFTEPRCLRDWLIDGECVYRVTVNALCERLRLMFFGNLEQDWSEFVLTDLGRQQYEKIAFCQESRGFRCRDDLEHYLQLHRCRERLHQGEPPELWLEEMPACASQNPWLAGRRAKLIFRIGQHYERLADFAQALSFYSDCAYPEARIRAIRVLERSGQFAMAFDRASAAQSQPLDEVEKQKLLRIMPRLQRKLGFKPPRAAPTHLISRFDLSLPLSALPCSVETRVREHLSEPQAPVHYVENGLINSLLGLLCWQTVFSALPGAFFHPFHRAPADLYSADFYARRAASFGECFAQLDSSRYQHTIRQNFHDKAGIQSPFVAWGLLSETLLDQALTCIPAAHLKKCFERILLDIKVNRSGLPDLIQFWPEEKRYRMVEVKGPGDRLQDNQRRWLDYCAAHAMPVTVCYVSWQESGP